MSGRSSPHTSCRCGTSTAPGGSADVDINGIALTDGSGNSITSAIVSPSTSPVDVAAGATQYITFTVTVPANGTAVTTDITGGLQLSLASTVNTTYNVGNNAAT
jgi:hypothetical protein